MSYFGPGFHQGCHVTHNVSLASTSFLMAWTFWRSSCQIFYKVLLTRFSDAPDIAVVWLWAWKKNKWPQKESDILWCSHNIDKWTYPTRLNHCWFEHQLPGLRLCLASFLIPTINLIVLQWQCSLEKTHTYV